VAVKFCLEINHSKHDEFDLVFNFLQGAVMKHQKTKIGQTLVEYGLIIALISAVMASVLLVSKSGISNTFSTVTFHMESASN